MPFPPFQPNPNPKARRLRRIPIRLVIPNLVTVLAICAGLSGVRMAIEGRFEIAVVLVLVAALLDGMDGRLARMLKATSNFGAQLDSLADIVNFGAVPALVLYVFLLDQAGAIGWIGALLFAIACCLRLARFNIMLDDPGQPVWKNDYFVGVPAPAGALLLLLPVYLGLLGIPTSIVFAFIATGYTVLIALLMISRVPVYSGKSGLSRVRRDLVVPLILGIVIYVALLTSYTWLTLTVTALVFLGSLPVSFKTYRERETEEATLAQPIADSEH